jgi:hypothetical protein
LIERVGDFDAHENKRYDHQIRAKMHELLETKSFPSRISRKAVNQIQYASERASARRTFFVSNGDRRLPPPRK